MKLFVFSSKDGDGCIGVIANNDKRAWDWVPEGDKAHVLQRPNEVIRIDEGHYRTAGLKFRYMPKR